MAYYYKISDGETIAEPPLQGIHSFDGNSEADCSGPCIKFDFSKHVLIELLDNVTPEAKLWTELGLAKKKNITHKRMIIDPHRVNCRRAVVVCSDADEAKELAQRLSQAQIMKRSICAVVIQELLSDICLFEKQIIQYGDKRSQHQLVYVTELTRRREPSGLAQYLREKFSPFGTILSVLVSEDKDGYAYPEGVIKFAHLSEAFAAELAYDQCAVALERLSVTTHHNILLSQCDLRARLREAYSRESSEFSFNVSHASRIEDQQSESTILDKSEILPSSNCKSSVKESENNESVLNESGSTVISNNEFPSDSAELADVLKKPCESNLVACLQSIAPCSESLPSRRPSNDSLPDTELGSTDQSTLPLSKKDSTSPDLDKTWSSRIVGWITDLPNINPSSQVDAIANDSAMAENDGPLSESTVMSDKDKNLGFDQRSKPTSPREVISSGGSFVTCTNGDMNSSFHSIPSSISDSNNVTMVEDKTVSHDSECNRSDISDEQSSNIDGSSVWESTGFKSSGSPVLSLKRRNTSGITEKLSLRSKRRIISQPDSVGEVAANETTLLLPSVPKTRTCSVVLNFLPELDKFAKNLSIEKSSALLLERLGGSSSNNGDSKLDVANMLNITDSKAKGKKNSRKDISSSSIKSDPIHRDEPDNFAENLSVDTTPALLSERLSGSLSNDGNSKLNEANMLNITDSKAKGKKNSKKETGSFSVKSQPIRRSNRLTSLCGDKKSNSFSSQSLKNGTKPSTPSSSIVDGKEREDEKQSPLRMWLRKELDSSTNNLVAGCKESAKGIVCATANKDVLISVGCSHMTCDFCYPDSTKLLLGFY